MRAFKFLIPNDNFYSLPDGGASYKGCLAVVIAESETAARDIAAVYGAREQIDMRWLAIARVSPLPIEPGVVALVME